MAHRRSIYGDGIVLEMIFVIIDIIMRTSAEASRKYKYSTIVCLRRQHQMK